MRTSGVHRRVYWGAPPPSGDTTRAWPSPGTGSPSPPLRIHHGCRGAFDPDTRAETRWPQGPVPSRARVVMVCTARPGWARACGRAWWTYGLGGLRGRARPMDDVRPSRPRCLGDTPLPTRPATSSSLSVFPWFQSERRSSRHAAGPRELPSVSSVSSVVPTRTAAARCTSGPALRGLGVLGGPTRPARPPHPQNAKSRGICRGSCEDSPKGADGSSSYWVPGPATKRTPGIETTP